MKQLNHQQSIPVLTAAAESPSDPTITAAAESPSDPTFTAAAESSYPHSSI